MMGHVRFLLCHTLLLCLDFGINLLNYFGGWYIKLPSTACAHKHIIVIVFCNMNLTVTAVL